MIDDLISRQAEIAKFEPWLKVEGYSEGELNMLKAVLYEITVMPPAQPETCDDAVSKEAVSSWLKQYGQDVLHGKYKFSLMYIWKNLMDLPSAEPKIIRCGECKYWRSDHTCKEHSLVSPMMANEFCSRAVRKDGEEG